jgi:ATP-dependent helicase/DNAse subunit B
MEFNDIKDFLSKSSDVIRFIGERTTASYHPYFNSFYERFLKELDSIKKSFISKYRFTDIKRYFFLFQSVFKRVSLPFDGTPLNGLQILGFLETRNIKFKNVYFFDVNEGVIPHTTKEESVLPTGVREHLGISTYKTKEKVARYYFDILIKSSENVHLFYIENNKSQRSRFAEELCWEEEKKTGKSEAAEKVKNIEYKINLNREASAGAEKTKEIADYFKEEFRYSASALNSYLHCGLKFYYSYALKLSEDGELAGEVEKKDIGNIVHEVLESYFEKLSGKVLEPGDINTALLDDIINLKFKEMFSDNLPGRIFLIKNQISYQLKKFMENYQLPLVLKSKVKVLGNEMKINADINGYRFKGFLDRVEERDDITYIIDYKTSSSDLAHKINFKKLDYESRESIETCIKSLQIPFYLMLYSNHKKTDVKDLRGIFLLLGKSKIDEKIEFNPFENEEEILKHYPKLLKLMFTLLDEICNKDIPFAAAKDEKTCMFCDFKSLCKTG